jgi:DNA invertase Pin-like site-specific DNA recombinase
MQNETMIYGYARVSTAAQDESGQVKQLKAARCGRIFREKVTGTTAERPQLAKLMKRLAPGDVVITPAVDRLSRDTTDLLVIAREIQRAGAGIRSLAEPYLDTTSDFAEIVFAILGVAAKLERRRILERTARGRADAKANGVKFGRKPILTRTNSKRPASASKRAKRSAASPAATMSARARFRDCRSNVCILPIWQAPLTRGA